MMQRAWTLVSSFAILAATGVIACSSADTPEGDDEETGGSSGSGGAATGGSATGGTATGGTATGGTATGGTAPTGGTGGTGDAPNPDPECKGISGGAACPIDMKMCPGMACGIADSGRRDCNCATNWTCTSCDYTNSPFKDKPADIPACTDAADEVPCTTQNQVCGPVGTEYCACYLDATDGLIWDCDKPPTSWM